MMSLESLPEAILEKIFSHLETPGILNLCWLSRDFYTTAAACLYRGVLVKNKLYDDIDWEAFEWATVDYSVTWNLEKLTKTLEKRADLAALVRSIAINVSSGGRKAPLFDLCANLKEYHFTGQVYKALSFLNTSRVSCHVQCCPIFDSNLTELRLRFTENPGEIKLFKTVADMMIARRAHVNLRTLAFEHSQVDLYGASYEWKRLTEEDLDNIVDSPWIAFFMRFAASKYTIKLKALCLQGMITTSETSIDFIRNAVELDLLETLELTVCEHSYQAHEHDSVDDGLSTFVLCFAFLVPNVTNLYLSHSSSCDNCDGEDVRRSIEQLKPNQLKKLVLRTPEPTEEISMILHHVILETQRNLVTLSYREDIVPPFDETGETVNKYDVYNIMEQQHYYERLRQKYTPHFLLTKDGHMVTSKQNEDLLKNHGRIVSKILDKDIIYVTAKESLPHLIEYRKHSLCVDIKNNYLLINGRRYNIAPFQSKARQDATRKSYKKHIDLHHSGERPLYHYV